MADTQARPNTTAYTAVSAPGKVLLAGGYLVLDREYTGLVFGLSARIHAIVQPASTSPADGGLVTVKSPQFVDAEWRYAATILPDNAGVAVKQLESPSVSRNPFVETTLTYTLSYVAARQALTSLPSLSITILADNDYYSQPSTTTTTTPSSPFASFPTPISGANKTGLGSSAALTTALTSSLLQFLLPRSSPPSQSQNHNLSQACHCAAQGKIGSGFDVAAAVYGTSLYRRFSPSLLAPITDAATGPGTPGFSTRLRDVVDDVEGKWDTQVVTSSTSNTTDSSASSSSSSAAATIPPGYALIMCDVDCGSQTVGMVKSVLAWRAHSPHPARLLWDSLQSANEELARSLSAPLPSPSSSATPTPTPTPTPRADEPRIRAAFAAIRALIRDMGSLSGVPIEPRAQTELLDALGAAVEGVVGGVVPGAGGYDAVALLVRDDEETMEGVRRFLEGWSEEREGRVKLLGVKGEMEGLRSEEGFDYGVWIS